MLNVKVDNISVSDLLTQLEQGIVFTPNVDHLVKLQQDFEFWKIYNSADYRLCDSQIVFYASRFLGTPICEKISGSDFFPMFCNFHQNNSDITIFLLGGLDRVAEKAAAAINTRIGRKIVVGSYSPSFGFENNEQECQLIVDKIIESGATVLAVGVGAPKQEKWIWKFKNKLPSINIFLAIGATIDFEAGIVKRAPQWLSDFGLEWLFRLMMEPRRLWKRYLVDDLSYFWLLFKQKIGLYSNPWSEVRECFPVDNESSKEDFEISSPLQEYKECGERLRVLMMGPSLSQQGGMATVENLLIGETADDVQISHIPTHEEGTAFHRIWIFCKALSIFILNLLRNRYDLVHIHVSEKGSVFRISILILISRFFQKPVVAHAHGCEFHLFYDSLPLFFQKCVSLVFKQCACLFVLSENWRDYYVSKCGLSPKRTVVLTNPVDFPNAIPERRGSGKVTLLFLGRIGQRKGAFDLLQAFSELPKVAQEKAFLVLAGDGDLKGASELVEALGIKSFVSLPGWLSQEQCKELLAQADTFILPSYNEALPMAILEAMSWGLPVISTDVGGIPEVILPGKTGILVTPGNVQKIKEAIQFFIENEEERVAWGLAARNFVEPLAATRYALHLANIYRTVVTSRELEMLDDFSITSINSTV